MIYTARRPAPQDAVKGRTGHLRPAGSLESESQKGKFPLKGFWRIVATLAVALLIDFAGNPA